MIQLKIGTIVFCKIKGTEIVYNYEDFDATLEFTIIGYDGTSYLLNVPKYYNIKDSFLVDEELLDKLNLHYDWLGKKIINIYETEIVKTKQYSILDGSSCKKCKEFYQFAEPNQPDGTMICYVCRVG
jgi:hypothetical protein